MATQKSITVFTPTYNRAYILSKCYESLCHQTCKDFEWLIIDDGSTDGTKELGAQWQTRENGYGNRNSPDSMRLNESNDALSKALIQQIVRKLVCLVLLYDITTKNRRGSQVIAVDMSFFVRKDHQLFFIGKVLVKENKTPLCVCVSKSL